MDESANTKEVKIRRGLPLMRRTPMPQGLRLQDHQQLETVFEGSLLSFRTCWQPVSTAIFPSSTWNAPAFGCFCLKSGAFPCFCALLTRKVFGFVFVQVATS